MTDENKKLIVWMEEVGIEDVGLVGGKNASLGEMLTDLQPKGVRIPSGYIVTAAAYWHFLKEAGLETFIKDSLTGLDTSNLTDLARRGEKIRKGIIHAELPEDLKGQIVSRYEEMEKKYRKNVDVAVRSSATAEDLPGASFAGEHETYLGIRGAEDVLLAVKSAMASLFTDRAISYRVDKGFDHFKIALSVAVQHMVRSDKGASGVMFTIDTESGFRDVVIINASWGLGEMVVQGKVSPDEYLVAKKEGLPLRVISRKLGRKEDKMIYAEGKGGIVPVKQIKTPHKERDKFVLTNAEIEILASWGLEIERHYSEKNGKWTPMDIEWAKDGISGELFIVQARPETVQVSRDLSKIKEYIRTEDGKEIVRGVSVGSRIATGKAHVIKDVKNILQFKEGEILVTEITDPDWEPIMKIASAIVTDKGGRTSHAAIVSRELGSDGVIFEGTLKFNITEHDIAAIPKIKTKIMMNIATPDTAFGKSFIPNSGVGLAREEFIIASDIGIHPLALLNFRSLSQKLKKQVSKNSLGWEDKTAYYTDNLAYGIAKIGLAFHPNPVIVRFSDFKTNEYRSLIGGVLYEPVEENPMIGWRSASRYYDEKFKEAFKLECLALKKVRNEMGLTNVIPMVPFCRTPEEGRKTLEIMAQSGLVTNYTKTEHTESAVVPVYVMCEIPSNVLLAEEFLEIFDGMSIGSNDLTQLILGLDRDSGIVSHVSNELDPSVKKMVSEIIKLCNEKGKYIGICGQAPSDYPEFAKFIVEEGIHSISLNPDTVVKTTMALYEVEKNKDK
ncbi:MAG: Phosphoenolpyruvate synthase [Parcubacteria group bacterium GW2011_GWA2_40_8]|nr:MAG: Phosphoenolpyruvate synthase [Parcubacteria group bacterium GW2011_GWA2_40_8]